MILAGYGLSFGLDLGVDLLEHAFLGGLAGVFEVQMRLLSPFLLQLLLGLAMTLSLQMLLTLEGQKSLPVFGFLVLGVTDQLGLLGCLFDRVVKPSGVAVLRLLRELELLRQVVDYRTFLSS
jgi:hypothetical protein